MGLFVVYVSHEQQHFKKVSLPHKFITVSPYINNINIRVSLQVFTELSNEHIHGPGMIRTILPPKFDQCCFPVKQLISMLQ